MITLLIRTALVCCALLLLAVGLIASMRLIPHADPVLVYSTAKLTLPLRIGDYINGWGKPDAVVSIGTFREYFWKETVIYTRGDTRDPLAFVSYIDSDKCAYRGH